MDIVKVESISKDYGKGENRVKALDKIDLKIKKGEFLAIVGTSGSGKSTLLHILGGLDKPTDGFVFINGNNLCNMSDEELTIFRRRNIGFVFQNYNLIPILTVYENIVLPIKADGNKVNKELLEELTKILNIKEKMESLPNHLSGGQQQRVAIARALITQPSLILADEPTGNLDSVTSKDVINLLRAAGKKYNQTIVMITHNDKIAQSADRIVRIEDGKIYNRGEWFVSK